MSTQLRDEWALDRAISRLLDVMWADLCRDFRRRPGQPIQLDDALATALVERWRIPLYLAAKYGASYLRATGRHPPEHDWTEDAITEPMGRRS